MKLFLLPLSNPLKFANKKSMKSYIEQSNTAPGEVTMRLYGEIGDKVDGDRFAQELGLIAKDSELIKLRINSPGGDVIQGMSIVSAMLSIDTPIHVYVDGIAASMGAVVAVCGDKIIMADYAKIMIHDPYFPGAKALTAKQKKLCDKMRDMLNQVLSRRGIANDAIAKLMADETWFSANEAKAAGLCDEIASSLKNYLADLNPMQLCAKINDDFQTNNNQNQNNMKLNAKLASTLCVAVDAAETDITAAIEKLVDEKAEAEKEKAEAVAAKIVAQNELKELKDKRASELAVEATEIIAQAVKDGRLDSSGTQAVKDVFAFDHNKGKALINALPMRKSIHSQIGNGGKVEDSLCAMSWDELDKTNQLSKLKAQYPDVYREKFNAKFHPEQE